MYNEIVFVFGSNLSGRHGAGAASDAFHTWQAVWGQGVGRTGFSYAIPTKDKNIYRTLPLDEIQPYVTQFVEYAKSKPFTLFYVTAFGQGLAGYKLSDIKPLFDNLDIPLNVVFTKDWL